MRGAANPGVWGYTLQGLPLEVCSGKAWATGWEGGNRLGRQGSWERGQEGPRFCCLATSHVSFMWEMAQGPHKGLAEAMFWKSQCGGAVVGASGLRRSTTPGGNWGVSQSGVGCLPVPNWAQVGSTGSCLPGGLPWEAEAGSWLGLPS